MKRFLKAQKRVYDSVTREIESGKKQTHWMWFIFPQHAGLGRSKKSKKFAIKEIDEARRYLQHPILGSRLRECTRLVINQVPRPVISEFFRPPDNFKLQSCMTLFALASHTDEDEGLFSAVLSDYFAGQRCIKTIAILNQDR